MFSALIKVVRWTGNKKNANSLWLCITLFLSHLFLQHPSLLRLGHVRVLGLSNGEKPDLKIVLTAGLATVIA